MFSHAIIAYCLIYHAIQTKSVTRRTQQYNYSHYVELSIKKTYKFKEFMHDDHHYLIYVSTSEWFYAQTLLVHDLRYIPPISCNRLTIATSTSHIV
jgi:hypothetical protein